MNNDIQFLHLQNKENKEGLCFVGKSAYTATEDVTLAFMHNKGDFASGLSLIKISKLWPSLKS